MSSVTVSVTGISELGERMRTLATKRALSACASATGSAARVIKDATKAKIRANPSIDSGSLLESVIVKKVPKSQTDLTSEHIVTYRGKGKAYNKKGQKIARAPHAYFVELGTVNMPAEPSLRPGFESKLTESVRVMAATLEKRLIKEGV